MNFNFEKIGWHCEAYTEDEVADNKGKLQSRVVMKLHPRLAPIKVAIFPLVKRARLPDIAKALYRDTGRDNSLPSMMRAGPWVAAIAAKISLYPLSVSRLMGRL